MLNKLRPYNTMGGMTNSETEMCTWKSKAWEYLEVPSLEDGKRTILRLMSSGCAFHRNSQSTTKRGKTMQKLTRT